MNRAMIDIETLSRQPDGCIISVGIALFDDTQIIASQGWAIDAQFWHGHMDPATIQWWMAQNAEAREYSFGGKTTDRTVALDLSTYLKDYNVQELWANDPSFDLVMLEQWWKRIPQVDHCPFKFWTYRSYRTITSLTSEITGIDHKHSQGKFVAHNPVEDAVAQARVVIACRNALMTLVPVTPFHHAVNVLP